MMKGLISGVFVMLFFASNCFAASTGTVTITGNIKNNTCVVSPSSTNFTVNLGDIASKQFFRVGASSIWTPFSIEFSSCGDAATGVKVGFTGNADSSDTTVLASETGANAAEGVGVEILDKNGNQIPLNVSGNALSWSTLTAGVANTLHFRSRMVATRYPVSAGNVNATANFTLEYQ